MALPIIRTFKTERYRRRLHRFSLGMAYSAGVDTLHAGKIVAMEVCGAIKLQDCWDIVDAHEKTKVPHHGHGECLLPPRYNGGAQHGAKRACLVKCCTCRVAMNMTFVAYCSTMASLLYAQGVEFGDKGFSEAKWRTNHYVKPQRRALSHITWPRTCCQHDRYQPRQPPHGAVISVNKGHGAAPLYR